MSFVGSRHHITLKRSPADFSQFDQSPLAAFRVNANKFSQKGKAVFRVRYADLVWVAQYSSICNFVDTWLQDHQRDQDHKLVPDYEDVNTEEMYLQYSL